MLRHPHTAPGLARGTRIACEDGPVAIENIKAGDIVNTRSNGPQVVRWVGCGVPVLQAGVCLQAGALGENAPSALLLVAPEQRLVVSDWRAELLFGSPAVFVAAKALLNEAGIAMATPEAARPYFHILFDAHEIVNANGVQCESFYPCAAALNALSDQARQEIATQIPGLHQLDPVQPFPPALPTITTAEAALLK